MAQLTDHVLTHAMEAARMVPGVVVCAGTVAGVAAFVAAYVVYRLASRRSEVASRVVYLMPYPAVAGAPYAPPGPDREAAIETGPMSVVTIERPWRTHGNTSPIAADDGCEPAPEGGSRR